VERVSRLNEEAILLRPKQLNFRWSIASIMGVNTVFVSPILRIMIFIQQLTSFLAISQLIFTGLYFIVFYGRQKLGQLYALYCLCLIAYIADNLVQLDAVPVLNHLASFFAILAPGVLWIICRYFLDDEPQFSKWVLAVIPIYTVLRFIGVVAEGMEFRPDFWLQFIFFIFPNFIMLAFASHIIVMSIRGRRGDLVEKRRQIRLPLAIVMGFLLLVVIFTEALLLPNSHLNNGFFFILFLFALTFNLGLVRNTWLDYLSPDLAAVAAPPDSIDELALPHKDKIIIEKIQHVMAADRRYRTMGLTIKDLAADLNLSEHHLRRVINHQLNYRNFNQFLNHYRIAEASRRLVTQAEAHLPILTIAMDVGYRSLSSFNKAFLDTHKITPSAYRLEFLNS